MSKKKMRAIGVQAEFDKGSGDMQGDSGGPLRCLICGGKAISLQTG